MKKTKIVCTIGPASEQKEMLVKLINAGMNVMRMNFSHGDHVEQGFRIKNVKELNKEHGWNIAIMLDTKGPEIRTGYLKNDQGVMLQAGKEIRLTMDYSFLGDEEKIAMSYPGLYEDIHVGGRILIEDGNISFTVLAKDEKNRELICRINNSRKLKNKRNCNVPGVKLNMKYIAEKDYKDIVFGCEQDIDFIAASFVRRAQDIIDIRTILAEQKNTHIKIISKIENQEGVDNMDEIIELSDGVMVARGDLGVDVDTWDLPQIQKEMIFKCQQAGKIVITATQMLDSMQQNPRPTRAEATDVHNSVLEGTYATMLSGESAQGDFPEEAVTYMAKIDETAEEYIDYDEMIERAIYGTQEDNELAAIALGAAKMALEFDFMAIVSEESVELAFALAQFKPIVDVFASVKCNACARTLALAWGVNPVVGTFDDAKKTAIQKLDLQKGMKILKVTTKSIEILTI